MTVQFAVGDEPMAIARGRLVTAWLHVRVEDTAGLSRARRSDVVGWLATLGLDADDYLPRLAVSRTAEGNYQLHLYRPAHDGVAETRHPVAFSGLPAWLREPRSEDSPVPTTPRTEGGGRDRAHRGGRGAAVDTRGRSERGI